MNTKRLKRIISRFDKAKVLVIGDLILDEFIWGKVDRISPEAPVPVVWINSESFMPGGAANVAHNVRSVGGRVFLAGIIGSDEKGKTLLNELRKKHINTEGIFQDRNRPTTVKTRVIAHHQQVVRIDREKVSSINNDLIGRLISFIKEKIYEVDMLIIEDYGKGVIMPELLGALVPLAKARKKMITVDPKESHFPYYKGVTVITPNRSEAARASGIDIKDRASLIKAGKTLLKTIAPSAVLITLGEDGMCLFEASGSVVHIPTVAQEVFDVAGAGDTVIATFSLALACGATMEEAAYISNYAAGIVVGKLGVAVTTQKELLTKISNIKYQNAK